MKDDNRDQLSLPTQTDIPTPMRRRRWTEADLAVLRQDFAAADILDLACRLGRTVRGIESQAWLMNLSPRKRMPKVAVADLAPTPVDCMDWPTNSVLEACESASPPGVVVGPSLHEEIAALVGRAVTVGELDLAVGLIDALRGRKVVAL